MPIRFDQGEIKRLMKHFNMSPAKKGSCIYEGIGHDGIWRRCKFDYHKDRDPVAAGTAKEIAKQLKFKVGISQGSEIELTVSENDKTITLKPKRTQKKYTLEELLSQITPENRHEEIDLGVEGRELI